jgi:hypothetical protein
MAGAVLLLTDPQSAYLSGVVLPVDGGWTSADDGTPVTLCGARCLACSRGCCMSAGEDRAMIIYCRLLSGIRNRAGAGGRGRGHVRHRHRAC